MGVIPTASDAETVQNELFPSYGGYSYAKSNETNGGLVVSPLWGLFLDVYARG